MVAQVNLLGGDIGFVSWASPTGAEERGWNLNFRLYPFISCHQQGLSVSLLAKVRRKNMYKEGDLTHFNQKLEGFTLPRCWEECLASSQYHARKREVDKFNE